MKKLYLVVTIVTFSFFVVSHTYAIETKFTIGDRVYVTATKLNVRKVPNGKNLGFQKQNAQGTILAGPTTAGSYIWYKINYDISPDGWSLQDYLEEIQILTIPPPPPPPPILTTQQIQKKITELQALLAQLIEALRILQGR